MFTAKQVRRLKYWLPRVEDILSFLGWLVDSLTECRTRSFLNRESVIPKRTRDWLDTPGFVSPTKPVFEADRQGRFQADLGIGEVAQPRESGDT